MLPCVNEADFRASLKLLEKRHEQAAAALTAAGAQAGAAGAAAAAAAATAATLELRRAGAIVSRVKLHNCTERPGATRATSLRLRRAGLLPPEDSAASVPAF